MPVIGSEERGASMLDSLFSKKAEHVPIKKRKFLFRSSSTSPPPPVVASQCTEQLVSLTQSVEDSNKLTVVDSASPNISLGKIIDSKTSLHDNKSGKANKGFGEGEDFSGISILAAAACSSSLGKESGYPEDGSGIESHLPTKRILREDLVNSSEVSTCAMSSCVSTEPVGELTSISPTVNSSVDFSCSKDEDKAGSVNLCSKDDRFYWDLNVVMDAWEHPFESSMEENDIPSNLSKHTGKSFHDDNTEDSCRSSQFKFVTTCATQTLVVPGESRTTGNQSLEKVDHDTGKSRSFPQPSYLDEKPLLSECKKSLDAIKGMCEDFKLMSYNKFTKSVDTTSDPVTHTSGPCVMDRDDHVFGQSLKLYGDVHAKGRSILQGLNLSTGGSYFTLDNIWSSNDMKPTSSCSEFEMDMKPNLAVLKNMKTSQQLQYHGNSLAEKSEIKIEPLGHPPVNSDMNSISSSSCAVMPNSISIKHEFLVDSDAEVHSVIKGEKLKLSEISTHSKEACGSVACHTRRANLEMSFYQTNFENSCSRPFSVVGTREDFDSQYEDGEVRERNEHPGGVEHVKFESEDMEPCTRNPTGYPISESVQVEVKEDCEAAGVLSSATKSIEDGEARGEDNKVKFNPKSEEKIKVSVSKELLVGRSCLSDMDTGVSDEDGAKGRLASNTDETETRIESKAFKRGLQSRIEGPLANDTLSREDWENRGENRYEESSSRRSFERPRYSFHNQTRGRQSDNWDGFPDNRMGFRRQYSPIMHRNVKQEGISYSGLQDDESYSHQLHPNSRSGDTEDDNFYPHCKSNRAFGRGGRSNSYCSLGENRGGRGGRYNGPSPNNSFQSSLKYRRPLSCRERSFSPFGGHGNSNTHQSRGKSPSQSRSRSPITWNSSRGQPRTGNCRSPNFGSDMRNRGSAGFVPDDATGFRSMPRNRGSPPHGRWNSSGKEEGGQFRQFGYKQRAFNSERSPCRTRFRGDRAGVYDPPRNFKPDGYYRVSEDASYRGPKYGENFEGKTKPYGPLRPAGRLHQHFDDSYSTPKGVRYNRDAPGFRGRGRGRESHVSDFPRRFRGGDGMESCHDLKSEEQYREFHTERFTDTDGVNRGRRYENFEERRKRYSPPNLKKRSDTEVSEKRLTHNLDEKFQDSPDFCGRGMRNFDGLSTRLREDKDSTAVKDNPQ